MLKSFKLFLHCLIFNVHFGFARRLSAAGGYLSYHIRSDLSRTFFDFFRNLFQFPAQPSALPRKRNCILAYRVQFVKHFFRKVFQSSSLSLSAPVRLSDSCYIILLSFPFVNSFFAFFWILLDFSFRHLHIVAFSGYSTNMLPF